jgi:hypothetical protein
MMRYIEHKIVILKVVIFDATSLSNGVDCQKAASKNKKDMRKK